MEMGHIYIDIPKSSFNQVRESLIIVNFHVELVETMHKGTLANMQQRNTDLFLFFTDAEGGKFIQRACHQHRGKFQPAGRLPPGVSPERGGKLSDTVQQHAGDDSHW